MAVPETAVGLTVEPEPEPPLLPDAVLELLVVLTGVDGFVATTAAAVLAVGAWG